jgi:hypothetical protein
METIMDSDVLLMMCLICLQASCRTYLLYKAENKFRSIMSFNPIFARSWCFARKFTSLRPSDFAVFGSNVRRKSDTIVPDNQLIHPVCRSVIETLMVQGSCRTAAQSNDAGNAYFMELVMSSLTISPQGVARARSRVIPSDCTIVLMDLSDE